MMRSKLITPLLLAAGMSLGGAAMAADPGPGGITTSVAPNGTVELSNVLATVKSVPVAGGAPAAPAPVQPMPKQDTQPANPAATSAAASTASATTAPNTQTAATDEPAKDPRQQYRDTMLQGAEGTTAANPSVARRYKMMDKETYRATVLGGASPPAQ